MTSLLGKFKFPLYFPLFSNIFFFLSWSPSSIASLNVCSHCLFPLSPCWAIHAGQCCCSLCLCSLRKTSPLLQILSSGYLHLVFLFLFFFYIFLSLFFFSFVRATYSFNLLLTFSSIYLSISNYLSICLPIVICLFTFLRV